jgi:hypothetical protein
LFTVCKHSHRENKNAIFCLGLLPALIKQFMKRPLKMMMQKIRDSGEMTKGPAPFSQKDAHKFASQLNQFLTKHKQN